MDAIITIQMNNGNRVSAENQNVLFEEFNDGCSIHSDNGTAIAIKAIDCASVNHHDDIDEIILIDGSKYTIEWL